MLRLSRSPPPARSGSPPSAPSGCAGRPAPCPSSTASTARRRGASSTRRGEGWLDPAGTRALLEAYGIPLVAERTAASADEAVAAARELGYPVVVKTAAAGAHKTETGGVALDLADEEQVREAVERIGAPVIVQQYLRAAPSCSPASCRTRSSARSSPSARAASSPS